jgi:hypothetical protein
VKVFSTHGEKNRGGENEMRNVENFSQNPSHFFLILTKKGKNASVSPLFSVNKFGSLMGVKRVRKPVEKPPIFFSFLSHSHFLTVLGDSRGGVPRAA